MIGSLTALPAADAGRTIQHIHRGVFYPKQLSLLITTSDSQQQNKRLEIYQWSNTGYGRRDVLPLRISELSLRDVDRNQVQDAICRTSDSLGRRGMTILTTDATTNKFKYLFRIDTIEPVLYRMIDTTIGLIQYDSLVDWSVGKFQLPSRLYRLVEGVYARKAFDSTWLRLIRYMRDSVTETFRVEREKVRQIAGEVSLEQSKKYLQALGGLVLLNPSWVSARTFMSGERTYMAGHLSENALAFLDRMMGLPRVAPFVEVANSQADEDQVILLAEFDESFRKGDQYKASLVMPRLARVISDQALMERITEIASLPGNTFALIQSAKHFWRVIAERYPRAGVAYRRWGILERRLGNEDTAQALIRRSLMFDSTSREAQEARQSLPYLE